MTIKIVEDGPDIVLTRSEEAHLRRAWQKSCQYTVQPFTFEDFVRGLKRAYEGSIANLGRD